MTDNEMTRFLAEKCMGYRVCESSFHPAWNPLSSISDAFQVVEKMRERDKYVRIEIQPSGKSTVMIWRNGVVVTERSDSVCRAICLAAIAALEGK